MKRKTLVCLALFLAVGIVINGKRLKNAHASIKTDSSRVFPALFVEPEGLFEGWCAKASRTSAIIFDRTLRNQKNLSARTDRIWRALLKAIESDGTNNCLAGQTIEVRTISDTGPLEALARVEIPLNPGHGKMKLYLALKQLRDAFTKAQGRHTVSDVSGKKGNYKSSRYLDAIAAATEAAYEIIVVGDFALVDPRLGRNFERRKYGRPMDLCKWTGIKGKHVQFVLVEDPKFDFQQVLAMKKWWEASVGCSRSF